MRCQMSPPGSSRGKWRSCAPPRGRARRPNNARGRSTAGTRRHSRSCERRRGRAARPCARAHASRPRARWAPSSARRPRPRGRACARPADGWPRPARTTAARRDQKGSEAIRRDPKGSEGIRRDPKGSEAIRSNQMAGLDLLDREVDASVLQAEARGDAAAHGSARKGVEHGASRRHKPSVHELAQYRAED